MSSISAGSRDRAVRSDSRRNDRLILEAAARVLADDPRATIQRIADEAGVARLTVYRRYRNRAELRHAVFETAAAEERITLKRTSEELDTLAALRALIRHKTAMAARYPLLAVGDDLQPMPGQPYRPTGMPVSRALHQATYELIARGQREGVLRSDVSAEVFALAMTGAIQLATRFSDAFRLTVDRVGEDLAALLLEGFEAQR